MHPNIHLPPGWRWPVPADTTAPLQGLEQQQGEASAHALSSTPSLAILDVADNMRAKIYAMLYRIGDSLHDHIVFFNLFMPVLTFKH